MIIQTAIVEDDAKQASLLQSYLQDYPFDQAEFVVSLFESAEDFLQEFSSGRFDLLLMDIQLPRMDGLSAARRVRETDQNVVLVFITSLSQFAVRGYEVDAKDYLVKPVLYDHFQRKMRRITDCIRHRPESRAMITISGGESGSVQMIPVSRLQFVEVFGHRLVYHTEDQEYEVGGKLSDVETILRPHSFLQCNRNTLVNPRFIIHLRGNTITVGSHEISISAPRRKEFLSELNAWAAS